MEEEEDDWVPSSHYGQQNSLLNPQIVEFKVQNNHEQGFSKVIEREPADEDLQQDNETDMDQCPYEFKPDINRKEAETYDDLLFHPSEDELNQLWTQKNLQKDKDLIQISCARCFTPLSYQGKVLKNNNKGDYIAEKVEHIIINEQKIVKSNKIIDESEDQFEFFYLKGHCSYCENDVALYDIERKCYYLFSVNCCIEQDYNNYNQPESFIAQLVPSPIEQVGLIHSAQDFVPSQIEAQQGMLEKIQDLLIRLYMRNKPMTSQAFQINFPKEAQRIKMRGVNTTEWKSFSPFTKQQRFHDIYNRKIPDALKMLNDKEAIMEFLHKKDLSHIMSKYNGLQQGKTVEELAQANNVMFEDSFINRARGPKNMTNIEQLNANFKNHWDTNFIAFKKIYSWSAVKTVAQKSFVTSSKGAGISVLISILYYLYSVAYLGVEFSIQAFGILCIEALLVGFATTFIISFLCTFIPLLAPALTAVTIATILYNIEAISKGIYNVAKNVGGSIIKGAKKAISWVRSLF